MRQTSLRHRFLTAAAWLLAAVAIAVWAAPAHAQSAVYMRSNTQIPWGQPEPTDHMDDVFGPGNWQELYYETAVPGTVFSPATTFVYMQGGDDSANELEAFLTANQATIESWVSSGGRLLVLSAPNEGDGMSYGFGGVTLVYGAGSDSSTATAAFPGHPIFNGPFVPVTTSYTGTSFSHAYVTGGGISAIIIDDDSQASLAELAWGSGHAVFGGLTTSNFWDPDTEAQNLDRNIIAYASQAEQRILPVPTLGRAATLILVLLVAGLGALVIRRLT